jgi:hypothetical protein
MLSRLVQLLVLLVKQDPVMDIHSCDSEGLLRLQASQTFLGHRYPLVLTQPCVA